VSALPEGYTLSEGAEPVAAHAFLTTSYWAEGISLDTVTRAFANSLAVSIRRDDEQVAAARVISDYATFAYLNDVYVLDDHRGKGLCAAMLRWLLDHHRLQGLGRWALFTKDMQPVYERFGWKQYPWPERMMIIDSKVFPA
jgi:GNAT superfamily N-acetyltransferase